ncbi:MAG: helix-turn-helix domain-containing protein [Chromatiales bacterium]|nr:helix-turn-helix domain-containing protein [Chromatiales bacterium]
MEEAHPAPSDQVLGRAIVRLVRDHAAELKPDDAFISSTEARRLAGNVSDMTIWRWVNLGVIPKPMKIRNRNYWRRGEFLAALERASSGPEAA